MGEFPLLQEGLKVSPGKKAAGEGAPSGARAASVDGPKHKKLKGGKEKEKEVEAADITKRPNLIPREGEGYTLHDKQPLAEHADYIECHVAAGTVSADARDSFLEGIVAAIEAGGGETIRLQRIADEHASNVAAAAVKRTAIEQQALVETLGLGKGEGKGSVGKYILRNPTPRFEAYTKSPNENARVANIVALSAKVNTAKDQES